MTEQTPLENILFGEPVGEWIGVLLDACKIDRSDEWVKTLEIFHHDIGDGKGPMEFIGKDDLIQIMVHCQNDELKGKLRELIGAL
jgi:hypothetical protein